jgi:L-aminopeptidase/D-esterase-like protein
VRFVPPVGPEWGRRACEAAADGPVAMGCVGAGTGAAAGSLKGGLGTSSIVLDSGITVAALVAANPSGSVVDPATGRPWEIALEVSAEFGDAGRRAVRVPAGAPPAAGRNTTLGVVATEAALTRVQALKVAQMAHDGLARAVRPAHTMFDGDTIFALALGRRPVPETAGFFASAQAQAVTEIGHAAADCVARAIIHAVLCATSGAGLTAFRDLPAR